MYIFKTEIPTNVKQKEICNFTGLAQPTVSNILNGKVACRKVVAFCITSYFNKRAKIEDYFTKI